MRKSFRNDTEPIFDRLARYCDEFSQHPFFRAARDGEIPLPLLREFAFHQYSDSILWIPMLALMKSKAVRSARLRRAIEANIACEAGLSGVSHVQLAVDLMRSLGSAGVDEFPTSTFAESAGLWLSPGWSGLSEAEVAGWLLVAETLVPIMFAEMKGCFERLDACAVAYFAEHVSVDTDEHAAWMAEAVEEVVALYGAAAVPEVTTGMEDAWRESLQVPDLLQEKRCASR
jgi:pyrroloquinoline quinone (PQQ) biosynthesis protein C